MQNAPGRIVQLLDLAVAGLVRTVPQRRTRIGLASVLALLETKAEADLASTVRVLPADNRVRAGRRHAQALASNFLRREGRRPDRIGLCRVPFYVRSLSPMLARPVRRNVHKPVLSREPDHARQHAANRLLNARKLAVVVVIAAGDRVQRADKAVPNLPQLRRKKAGARKANPISSVDFPRNPRLIEQLRRGISIVANCDSPEKSDPRPGGARSTARAPG